MKLAIISHTEHYKNNNGTIVGWGPTVSEINHLSKHFTHIYHVAPLHKLATPPSALPYLASNITFVALPPSGGKTVIKKLSVIGNMPKVLSIVQKTLRKVDSFQLRLPVGMGVYLIPYLTFFSKKKGWYKYAGNWNQKNAPFGYALQRAMLKIQKRSVTINGRWDNQPKHCITFENPCLKLEERKLGLEIIKEKHYAHKFSFCFVGRLEDEKGVQRIIDAFKQLGNNSSIDKIHFVGNGEKIATYKLQCEQANLPATFYGFLNRDEVFNLYKNCHFLLLPSTASEGFPKVIAEAMNFGCLPIVSDVSSIAQYVTEENGTIVSPVTSAQLCYKIDEVLKQDEKTIKEKAFKGHEAVAKFTFENYSKRILTEILIIHP